MRDNLYFYCSGRNSQRTPDDGSGGATGLAVLRRDGFASMDADADKATLTTRPITFQGRFLYANVDCPQGSLQAEVLTREGSPIAAFSLENSIAVTTDKTRVRLSWNGVDDLSSLKGKTVRFRFHMTRGSLYSFWVSPDKSGASHG